MYITQRSEVFKIARENFSRKRVAIYQTLADTKVHPTAEWVYNQLKSEYSDLSLGTVYRNIKKFCQEEKVRSIGVINGQEHFDADLDPHAHFVCNCCGSILDVDKNFFTDEIKEEISRQYSFLIETEELMFRGLCSKCKHNHS